MVFATGSPVLLSNTIPPGATRIVATARFVPPASMVAVIVSFGSVWMVPSSCRMAVTCPSRVGTGGMTRKTPEFGAVSTTGKRRRPLEFFAVLQDPNRSTSSLSFENH